MLKQAIQPFKGSINFGFSGMHSGMSLVFWFGIERYLRLDLIRCARIFVLSAQIAKDLVKLGRNSASSCWYSHELHKRSAS